VYAACTACRQYVVTKRQRHLSCVIYDNHAPSVPVCGLHSLARRQEDLISAIIVSTNILRRKPFALITFHQPYNMSTQQQPPPPTRTWEWIVFSCLTTLLPANSTIMRPDPVVSAFQRVLLTLVLHIKTLLLPQLVLFEAATHFGSARLIRDRVNDAARRSHYAYLATHDEQPTTPDNPNTKAWVVRQWDLLCGNTVEVYTLVRPCYDTSRTSKTNQR
jgi:hypothetical protein